MRVLFAIYPMLPGYAQDNDNSLVLAMTLSNRQALLLLNAVLPAKNASTSDARGTHGFYLLPCCLIAALFCFTLSASLCRPLLLVAAPGTVISPSFMSRLCCIFARSSKRASILFVFLKLHPCQRETDVGSRESLLRMTGINCKCMVIVERLEAVVFEIDGEVVLCLVILF
jgi:hypothetical protein